MTTSSAQKSTTTSPCGDNSKNHAIDKYHTCRQCDNPVGYSSQAYPDFDFPDALLVCPLCGEENADLSGFYLVNRHEGSIASPEFSTIGEAEQFADIFGLSKQSGYGITECTSYFNGPRDEQRRREHVDRLAWGRQTLTRLIELLPTYLEPGELKILATVLQLKRYSLPLFGKQPTAERAE